jgi:hypothetical protein
VGARLVYGCVLHWDGYDQWYLANTAWPCSYHDEYIAFILNNLDNFQQKILVVNMYATNSKSTLPFMNLSDCPIFLDHFDPSDEQFAAFR